MRVQSIDDNVVNICHNCSGSWKAVKIFTKVSFVTAAFVREEMTGLFLVPVTRNYLIPLVRQLAADGGTNATGTTGNPCDGCCLCHLIVSP